MAGRPPLPEPDKPEIREAGKAADGETIYSEQRLFFQLLAFGDCLETDSLVEFLDENPLQLALYEDLNDPFGIALVSYSDDPAYFMDEIRPAMQESPFDILTPKPEYSMSGRTYSIGYEQDLDETLVNRPRRNLLNPDLPWAVFYPVKRSGAFNQLELAEQRKILAEHGGIGRAFGHHDLAHDIRLAGFGMNKEDNDFIVGLVGKDLHPLSAIVQTMRKTRQTSEFITHMGPFFVGRKIWSFEESD